jgi:hypothetical protein
MPTPHSFRRQCRVLRWATVFVFVCLVGLLLPGLVGLPHLPPGSAIHVEGRQRLLLLAVHGLPAVGYLWALWSVQRALGDLAAGRTFHPTVARAMRYIGAGVLAGALLEVFAVTNLMRLVLDGRGSYLYFDLSAIVLGVVGAALVLLARLVDQARALQAELDEMF